ncbi:MAG: hypothetical protein KGL39_52610, partial [Patescibacteria group bacterium]|nr:hypothetical protein [Patescibacteria group bacterium]
MSDTATIHETIQLTLDSSGVKANSLAGLLGQLDKVETQILKINAAFSGMNLSPKVARSTEQMLTALKKSENDLIKLMGSKSGFSSDALAKTLAFNKKQISDFDAFLSKYKTPSLKKSDFSGDNFRNLNSAARALGEFEKRQVAEYNRTIKASRMSLEDLLKPGASQVTGPSGGKATVAGSIELVIPAAQVQASVVGPIQVTLAGSQFQVVPPTDPRGKVDAHGNIHGPDGKIIGKAEGAGGGGGKKKGKGGGFLPSGQFFTKDQPGETGRVLTETADYAREAITQVNALGELVTTTHDQAEGIIKASKKKVSGRTPLQMYRDTRAIAEQNFKQARATLDPNDMGFGLASLQEKQAAQLRALKGGSFMAQLGAPQQKAMESLLEEQAKTLDSMAGKSRTLATQAVLSQRQQTSSRFYQGMFQQFGQDPEGWMGGREGLLGPRMPLVKGGARGAYEDWWATAANKEFVWKRSMVNPGPPPRSPLLLGWNGQPGVPAVRGAFGGVGRPGRNYGPEREPYIDVESWPTGESQGPKMPWWHFRGRSRPDGEKQSKLDKTLGSLTVGNFAANIIKVTEWAAAVGVLYKSIELASYSLSRLVQVGSQSAHLGVVFRNVGGNAKQLTADIMALAAAQGRDTSEALESATEWARLGGTRKQVNEQVRVSAMAANIANMHMNETTKQLSSLMHVYHFQVSDMNGVVGMLANT